MTPTLIIWALFAVSVAVLAWRKWSDWRCGRRGHHWVCRDDRWVCARCNHFQEFD